MTASTASKYPKSLRIIHWVTVFLITIQIPLGFIMEDESLTQILAHAFTGAILFGLTLARLAFRLTSPLPPPHIGARKHEILLSKIVHLAIYPVLLMTALSGYGGAILEEHLQLPGFAFLTGLNLPEETGDFLIETHETLVFVLLALIGIHIAGFMKHTLYDKTDLLKRMI